MYIMKIYKILQPSKLIFSFHFSKSILKFTPMYLWPKMLSQRMHSLCLGLENAARLFLHSLQQWALKVPYLDVLLPVFIFHLLEKQSERQRSWTHWFMIYFPHGHSNQNSARPKSGARNSLLAPRLVARTQVLGPSCIAFQSLHL